MLTETLEELKTVAKAKATAAPVRYGTLAPYDCHRQGDVYILTLSSLPRGLSAIATRAQLAPGETQGSRHCIAAAHLGRVKMYQRNATNPLEGPVIDASDEVEITHPEHGHVILPKGVYGIYYQRQMAEELRRVAD